MQRGQQVFGFSKGLWPFLLEFVVLEVYKSFKKKKWKNPLSCLIYLVIIGFYRVL